MRDDLGLVLLLVLVGGGIWYLSRRGTAGSGTVSADQVRTLIGGLPVDPAFARNRPDRLTGTQGVVQGIQSGASVGTVIAPGIGTAIGAGTGALGGFITSQFVD